MSPFFYTSSNSNTQLVVYMSKAHVHITHSSTRLCATTDHSTYTHRQKTRERKIKQAAEGSIQRESLVKVSPVPP